MRAIEENLNSITENRLIPKFINNFSGDKKACRDRAIENILIADKQVSKEEEKIFQRCDNDFFKKKRLEVDLCQL